MTKPSATGDGARVHAALRDVIEPELGYNIVDRSLVEESVIGDGVTEVTMTMATVGGPAQDYIVGGVEHRLTEAPAVRGVFVAVVWKPVWSPHTMSTAAKAHFRIGEDSK